MDRPHYPGTWRRRAHYVAVDMSTEFGTAVRSTLPRAKVSADHFHVVAKTNDVVISLRRLHSHQNVGRRGRMSEPAYRYCKLRRCNMARFSKNQTERLKEVHALDRQLGIIHAIEEHIWDLLKTSHMDEFQRR